MSWYGEVAYLVVDLEWHVDKKSYSPCAYFPADNWKGSGLAWSAYKDAQGATETCNRRNRELARKCGIDLSLFFAQQDGVNKPRSGGTVNPKFWNQEELRIQNLDQATDEELDQILDCLGLKFCEIQEVELF